MIFFSNIQDHKPTDYGKTVKYLFYNDEDNSIEYLKQDGSLVEYMTYFKPHHAKSRKDSEMWQFAKLINFGNVIINQEGRCHNIKEN